MGRQLRQRAWRVPRALVLRLPLVCLLIAALACALVANEPFQQKTASQIYFETLGALPVPAEDPPGFPREWKCESGRTFQLRGRIDFDSIWTAQSAGSQATYGDLGDVAGLRRARIGAQGDLLDGRRYECEIDMASGMVVPQDVFIGSGLPDEGGERRYGHFREPFSLEGNTSANYFMFLERSPVNDLDPARAWGICLFRAYDGAHRTFALGAFHNGNDDADFDAGNNASAAITGRITAAPVLENGGAKLLHLGFVFSERFAETGTFTINQRPTSPLLDTSNSTLSPFIPEIEIEAVFQQLFNLQLATCDDAFWTQSEWYGSIIPESSGGDTVFLRGFYVSCGYFLTGEHRAYQQNTGVLGPVSVARPLLHGAESRDKSHGWGAWELTARFAYLNYFDLPPGPAGTNVGIRFPQATFGVNWMLSDRVRLMFNYNYATPDEANVGTTEASVYAMRLNVFW